MNGGSTPNLVLKRMLKYLLRIPQVRLQNIYKKENFTSKIKPMIENLQDELYQIKNKQAKSVKLRSAKNTP